jgi:hypothetical protein
MKNVSLRQSFIILLLLYVCSFPSQTKAQQSPQKKKSDFWQRVTVGGNFGLQFGTVTAINISPEVMVRTVDQLYLGLGFSYDYMQANNYFYNTATGQYLDYKSNVYGGRIFARYYLRSLFDNFLGNIFAHVEYEYLFYTRPYTIAPYDTTLHIIDPYYNFYKEGKQRVEVNSLFVGAGYDQPLGSKVFLSILILYNLNDSYNSPYSNPVFRLGVGVGL